MWKRVYISSLLGKQSQSPTWEKSTSENELESKLISPGGSETLSVNSTYIISEDSLWYLRSTLLRLSNTSSDDQESGISNILYNLPDLGEGMNSMSGSLTDLIRTGDGSTTIPGKAFWDETYFHVRWPWIILPTAAIIFSIALFIATAIASRKLHVVLWKSSVLPLLMHRLETEPEYGFGSLRNVDKVQSVSKVIAEEDQISLLLSEKLADWDSSIDLLFYQIAVCMMEGIMII